MVYSSSYWNWGVEERHFRRRNQLTPTKRIFIATLGEVLLKKASHKSYQGYLLHQIIHIMILPYPFGVSTTSHISRSGYTPDPYLSPEPDQILPEPHNPLKRADKCL